MRDSVWVEVYFHEPNYSRTPAVKLERHHGPLSVPAHPFAQNAKGWATLSRNSEQKTIVGTVDAHLTTSQSASFPARDRNGDRGLAMEESTGGTGLRSRDHW